MHRNTTYSTLALGVALALASGWTNAAQASKSTADTNRSSAMSGYSAAQPGSPADTTHKMGASGDKTAATDKAAAGAKAKLSHADKEFIEDAAKGGMFEVESGKLAAQKASDPQVKEFANKLVQDHTKANDELKQIAEAKGVALPDKDKWADKHELNKLEKMNAKDFDHEFAEHSVKDHEKDIKKFEKAASKLDDPDLKAFAEKQLPVLREHLAMAQKLPAAGSKHAAADKAPDTHAAGNKGAKY